MAKKPAAHALDKARETFPESVVSELEKLEKDLGGRQALIGLLTLAPLNDDLRYILGLLADPKAERLHLATICARGNLLPGELMKHIGAAALLRGKTLALQRIGDGIANVAGDVMRRAAPYEARCSGPCQGTGYVVDNPTPEQPNPSPVACPVCKGAGQLTFEPDLDRQKLAIEMAQLLPKGGGINILNQQNNAGGAVPGGSAGLGTLEKLQALTDRILYGDAAALPEDDEPIEGEIAPEAPPA